MLADTRKPPTSEGFRECPWQGAFRPFILSLRIELAVRDGREENGGDRKSSGQNDHLNQPSFVAQTQEATGKHVTQQEVADAAGVTQGAVAQAANKNGQQAGIISPPPSTLSLRRRAKVVTPH
jgi:hypothetical protein